jgi:hypothetical protein
MKIRSLFFNTSQCNCPADDARPPKQEYQTWQLHFYRLNGRLHHANSEILEILECIFLGLHSRTHPDAFSREWRQAVVEAQHCDASTTSIRRSRFIISVSPSRAYRRQRWVPTRRCPSPPPPATVLCQIVLGVIIPAVMPVSVVCLLATVGVVRMKPIVRPLASLINSSAMRVSSPANSYPSEGGEHQVTEKG